MLCTSYFESLLFAHHSLVHLTEVFTESRGPASSLLVW